MAFDRDAFLNDRQIPADGVLHGADSVAAGAPRKDFPARQFARFNLQGEPLGLDNTPAGGSALLGNAARRGSLRRSNSLMFQPQTPLWAAGGSTSYTWGQLIGCPSEFHAVRIGIPNANTGAALSGITGCLAVTDNAASSQSGVPYVNGTAQGAAAWTPLTWTAGAASSMPSLSAPTEAGLPNWSWSDWIPIKSLAKLLLVRLYFPSTAAGFHYHSLGNYSGSADGANAVWEALNAGQVWRGFFASGDKVSTPDTNPLTNSAPVTPVFAVDFRTDVAVARAFAAGDSIMAGYMGQAGSAAVYRAARANGIMLSNFSYSGLTSTKYFATMAARLADQKPDLVVIPSYTPNDNIATDALLAAAMNRLSDALEQIRRADATAVVATPYPQNGTTAGVIANMAKIDAFIKGLAGPRVKVADMGGLHDGTAWGTWAPGMNYDTLHPAEQGVKVQAEAFRQAIAAAL